MVQISSVHRAADEARFSFGVAEAVQKTSFCYAIDHRVDLTADYGWASSPSHVDITVSHLRTESGCGGCQYFAGMKRQQQAPSGSVGKVMHGQYGLLLHAPSITACGIAWGLHCKQNSIYICKTNFVVCFPFS